MTHPPRHLSSLVVALLACSASLSALAQDARPAPGGGDDDEGTPQPPSVTVTVPPAPPPQVIVPGYPAPGTDPNAHLPSSSRGTTDTSRSSDGFDLLPKTSGPSSVRGATSGSYVVEGQFTPEAHTVRRGDTLWDISSRYTSNPYNWPRIWSYNPQIQNPHWIYPGDRIRLRDPGAQPREYGGFGFGQRRPSVPPGTVFLREVGWIDDPDEDSWGVVVGAPDDQMLLSEGDHVYIQLEEGHDVQLGQELSVWQPLSAWRSDGKGGKLVSIRGTARIDRYNPNTHMVRALLTESVDVVERGAKVGPVGRRFDIVPPVTNERDLEAGVIASVYPHQYYGQNQVVFIDKGSEDGVKPGHRFFAVRRGDRWRETLSTAGRMATLRPRVEDQRPAEVDEMYDGDEEERFPDETYAELRIVSVKKHTSAALVTASTHEIERTARLVARKGY